MSIPLFTNNASTTLALGIGISDTTINLYVGSGSLFPSPVNSNYFYISMISSSTNSTEIMKCTGRSGDTLTVVRAQDGTSAQTWSVGDRVELRVTAASLNFFANGSSANPSTATQVNEFTATQGQTTFTLSFNYLTNSNNLVVFVNGSKQIVSVNYNENSSSTIQFLAGLNVGDLVEVIYNLPFASGSVDASNITYNQGSTGAVITNVKAKLQETVSVFDFMTTAQIADVQAGTMLLDVTTAINNAVAALPQTNDVYDNFSGNYYSGTPGPILYFPAGTYKVTSSIVIQKNNVTLRGDGWNNSILKFSGSGTIQGVVRFLNANTCEMSDMGIDGGLPYNPTLSETYGADAGLICDLTPFFTSRNLWIANTRKSGLVAIHLWESFFENFQVRNTGWFTNEATPVKGAAIYFCADAAIKQSSNVLGAGYESTNTVFVKAKLVPVGSIVLCEAPTSNITLISPITENRDFATYFAALAYTKYSISSLNNNFVIQGGYFYGHSHTFVTNATLFSINNSVPGISIKNFYVYTYVPTGYAEVTKIFSVAGQHNVCFDGLVIDDANTVLTTPFTITTSAGYPGLVYGDIMYNAPTTVTAAALIGANNLGYKGTLTCVNTATQVANRNTYFANARPYNTLTSTNQESFSCRAWVNFNGTTGTIRGSGNVSSVTRNSVGNYTVNFTDAMPDTNYVTNASANRVNTASESTEVGSFLVGSVNIANRDGATFYDPTIVCVTVHR